VIDVLRCPNCDALFERGGSFAMERNPRKPIEINDTRLENISEISLLSRESLRKNERVADKIQNPVKVRVERRRCRRYPFVASVELVDLESALQLQERVTDLSLYGCGVTASKPLPVGIKLRVRITSKGSTFSLPQGGLRYIEW